eukprot:gene13840-biopygen6142
MLHVCHVLLTLKPLAVISAPAVGGAVGSWVGWRGLFRCQGLGNPGLGFRESPVWDVEGLEGIPEISGKLTTRRVFVEIGHFQWSGTWNASKGASRRDFQKMNLFFVTGYKKHFR